MTPLKYQRLACAASFRSAQCESNGMTAISNRRLRILACENLSEVFHQSTVPLRYTPRKMCSVSADSVVVIEADHNSVPQSARKKSSKNAPSESQVGSPIPENDGMWAIVYSSDQRASTRQQIPCWSFRTTKLHFP